VPLQHFSLVKSHAGPQGVPPLELDPLELDDDDPLELDDDPLELDDDDPLEELAPVVLPELDVTPDDVTPDDVDPWALLPAVPFDPPVPEPEPQPAAQATAAETESASQPTREALQAMEGLSR
jgi:hypothetical protein